MRVLITAGPTQELIDPVRYITNGSSGKQGYELADYMSQLGYYVELVSGPVNIKSQNKYKVFHVRTAEQMLQSCLKILPVDIAIFTAAVTDWSVEYSKLKIKKCAYTDSTYRIKCSYNTDILEHISTHSKFRPRLVVGFALESDNILENAYNKLIKKKCDWIIANDINTNNITTMGSDYNQITIITKDFYEFMPIMTKKEIARYLGDKIHNTVLNFKL